MRQCDKCGCDVPLLENATFCRQCALIELSNCSRALKESILDEGQELRRDKKQLYRAMNPVRF